MRCILIGSALLIGCVSSCLGRDLTGSEKQIIEKVVTKDFKDPSSAQFRWLPMSDDRPTGTPQYYCGMVNAKNSYGAYAGFTPFIVAVGAATGRVEFAIPIGVFSPGDARESNVYDTCREKGFDPSQAN